MTGGQEVFRTFGLIESAEIVRETRDGRMQEVEIKLSDWVFNAIRSKEVLTLHRDYFRLRKPLERRIYEIARKHCGAQKDWRIGLALLQKKCGSNSTQREFRRLVMNIVHEDRAHDHMPDYSIDLNEKEDTVIFVNRQGVKMILPQAVAAQLDPDVYETARMLAPGHDVHFLEREWRQWLPETPHNPEAAFLGFCRKWIQNRKNTG